MATKAHLEGNKRYLATQDEITIRVPKGNREKLREHAASKGFDSLQGYIKEVLKKDSGLDL